MTQRLSGLLLTEAMQRASDQPENIQKARSLTQGAGHKVKDQGKRDVTLRTTGGVIVVRVTYIMILKMRETLTPLPSQPAFPFIRSDLGPAERRESAGGRRARPGVPGKTQPDTRPAAGTMTSKGGRDARRLKRICGRCR